jgi:alpha-1,3-rhamnosyl/mannosyltransferase
VDDARLAALYANADLVVVPSVYEGFGLPVVEAFAAGAPVACSNTSSLPEVAGDAAVLFDPADAGAIAAGIREALRPGAERDARVERGRRRAAALTWERCAESFLDVFAATSAGPA